MFTKAVEWEMVEEEILRRGEILSLKRKNLDLTHGFILLDKTKNGERREIPSHLIMSGVDLATVKELLGHKGIKMTLRYANLTPAHKAQAVVILDKTFQKSSTSQKLHNLKVVG